MQYSPVNNLIMRCFQQTYAWLCMYIYHNSYITNQQQTNISKYTIYLAMAPFHSKLCSLAFHFSTDRTWGHRWKGDRCGVGLCLRGARRVMRVGWMGILLGTPYRMGKTSDGEEMLVCTPWKKNIKTSSLYLPKTIVHSAKPVFTNWTRARLGAPSCRDFMG